MIVKIHNFYIWVNHNEKPELNCSGFFVYFQCVTIDKVLVLNGNNLVKNDIVLALNEPIFGLKKIKSIFISKTLSIVTH